MESNLAPDIREAAKQLRSKELSRYRIQHDGDSGLCLLAQLAVQITGAEIGGITLVHNKHVAVVTGAGIAPQQFDRADSICAHAVDAQAEFFEVTDLQISTQFASNQFPEMRHYAAATLFSQRGYVLGTLWVMGRMPARLEESEKILLKGLGRLVVHTIDLRYCDAVTGLFNRFSLVQQLQDFIATSNACDVVVGYIDLAGFHQVNELYGRSTGDLILAEVASRLLRWAGPNDFIGHFGGDRFGFALSGPVRNDWLPTLRLVFDAAFTLPDTSSHRLSARIGVIREPLPTRVSAGALFDMAETASAVIGPMHGFSVVQEYGQGLRDRSRMLDALLSALRGFSKKGELSVYFQPQVNFVEGKLIGFEALARWAHPQLGKVPTQTFVALAESSGHSYDLDMYVARLVCLRLRSWQDAGLPSVPVSLNLSRASLVNPRLQTEILELLEETGLPGALLEVEVTESQLIDAPQTLYTCVDSLRALGIHIAIDDFGIGYSNLDAIASMRFDRLKVDRRFVHGVADNATTASLFQVIQGVAQVSGAELLCEGIERQSDLDWLRHHRAYCVQGWYFSSAQPADVAEHVLRNWQRQLQQNSSLPDLRTLFA